MSLDKLKAYEVNKAFTEGVNIFLDDAPEVEFLVKLPGQYNRAYIAALYGGIQIDITDTEASEVKTNVLEARESQVSAFVEHCIVSIDGEDVPKDIYSTHPAAVNELIAKAQDLVEAIDKEVELASKKSSPTSLGSVGGATG